VAELVIYPLGGGPQPGPAIHGKGINLLIDGTNYPVNFNELIDPSKTERPLSDFIPENIIDIYTMGGSFSYDQIVVLYDYKLTPYNTTSGCFPVTWSEIQPPEADPPMVNLSSGLPVVTGLAECGTINDLFTIEMVRKVIIEQDGIEPHVLYWKDLPLTPVDPGEGEEENVVFFADLLEAAGYAVGERTLYDYNLLASDNFGTWFTYGHGHLESMYFNPLTNKTWGTDEGIITNPYSGRYSVKALLKVYLDAIPQEDPPSICITGLGCLTDPTNTDVGKMEPCFGCHVKKGNVNIPVNCAMCH